MSGTKILSGIQPKAVMSAREIAEWEALPAAVQLERMRAAIDKGINSGVSDRTMDDILQAVLARHPNGQL